MRFATVTIVGANLVLVAVLFAASLSIGCSFSLFASPGDAIGGGDRRIVKPGEAPEAGGGGQGIAHDAPPPAAPPWWADRELLAILGSTVAVVGHRVWSQKKGAYAKNGK